MPTTPAPNQVFSTVSTPSSQPQIKLPIVASADTNLPVGAKAVSVHTQLGGRVHLVYIPYGNTGDEPVDIYVPDGWVSDSMVKRVVSASAVGAGDAVTVWGLYN